VCTRTALAGLTDSTSRPNASGITELTTYLICAILKWKLYEREGKEQRRLRPEGPGEVYINLRDVSPKFSKTTSSFYPSHSAANLLTQVSFQEDISTVITMRFNVAALLQTTLAATALASPAAVVVRAEDTSTFSLGPQIPSVP
jgi:hypothetical protein